jgi:TldD protein
VKVTAEGGGEMCAAGEAPGNQRGFEFFDELDVDAHAREAAERTVRMLSAGYVAGGPMPVVVGNGFGGAIFLEAGGHLLETVGVRHDASVFVGRLGEQIAHAEVTALVDATRVGLWGSIRMDDEGMPGSKTVLIDGGVLRTYLSDRAGAQQTGVPRSGNGRRESYRHAPLSYVQHVHRPPASTPRGRSSRALTTDSTPRRWAAGQ